MVVGNKKVLKEDWAMIDNLPVHINVTKDSGCYEKMLVMFKKQLDIMLQHHRKVLVVPLTVNFRSSKVANECQDPERIKCVIGEGKNTIISQLMRDIRSFMYSQYGKQHLVESKRKGTGNRNIKIRRLGFFWSREFSKEGSYPHYHLWLMVDGSQLQSGFKLAQRLMPLAKKFNLALCYMRNSARTIDRSNVSNYWSLLYHFSYSAKEASKDSTRKSKNANEYSSSKLKPPSKLRWEKFTQSCIESHIQQGNIFSIYRQKDYLSYRNYSEFLKEVSHL